MQQYSSTATTVRFFDWLTYVSEVGPYKDVWVLVEPYWPFCCPTVLTEVVPPERFAQL